MTAKHVAQDAGRHAHDRAFWQRTLAEAAAGSTDGLSRRGFLQMVGASAALAGLSGACFEAPQERILPYTHRPDEVLPGVPSLYATTLELGGYGIGALVESHEGRPVKVEGNPDHPASLGSAGHYEQASLLGLYDPARLRSLQHERRPVAWEQLHARCARPGAPGATRLLLEPTASPLVLAWLARLRARRPDIGVHFYAPLVQPDARRVTARLFGRPLEPLAAFDAADVVVSLDADFLGEGPFRLRHAHDFASRRRIHARDGAMNRLYSAAPSPGLTSEMADHALACDSRTLRALAASLALAVMDRLAGGAGSAPSAGLLAPLRPLLDALAAPAGDTAWVRAAADDLTAPGATGLVVVGEAQLPDVQALGHAINAMLPGAARCLRHVQHALRTAEDESETLAALVEAARAGHVQTLAVLGGNPCHDAPAELDFAAALSEVETRIALSLHPDETTLRASWWVPRLHPLESWGDARALDGTASIVQPLIAPLYGGWTVSDALAAFAGEPDADAHRALRAHWAGIGGDAAAPADPQAEAAWRQILQRGVVPGTDLPSERAPLAREALAGMLRDALEAPAPAAAIELAFREGTLHDGRHANNPWLQELPDPITKLTWGNAAWVSATLARRLGLEDGDPVRIDRGSRTLLVPILRVTGQAENVVTLTFGYGRDAPLPVARDVGVDVFPLWSGSFRDVPGSVARPERPLPRHALARTQTHFDLHGREEKILRRLALDAYRTHDAPHASTASLYPPKPGAERQWGMAVDLTVCTGCAACVVACQAENNIPTVGRPGVLKGREMHWIRIDRYELPDRSGDARPVPQPMLCQHCEKAPCEYVCPVNATVHSADGLNEMIYNRCVGTRFCANNCPYQVRRFNWFEYQGDVPPARRMQHNPQVTVRARGVMEKCTYCVQRIRTAEIDARNQDRALRDGEVVTACQQACPTGAITFGDVSDPESAVSRVLRAPQAYGVLADLGTRPRTRYLARVHNPSPALAPAEREEPG